VVNTKADFSGGRVLLSSSRALLPVLEDMAAGPGDSATAWSGRAVPSALESDWAVALGRYRTSLGSAGSSDAAPPD
jgi:hypothetical protein